MKRRQHFRSKIIMIFWVCIVCCMLLMTVCSRFLLPMLFVRNSKRNMISCVDEVEEALKNDGSVVKELTQEINTSHLIHIVILNDTDFDEAEDEDATFKMEEKILIKQLRKYKNTVDRGEPYMGTVERSKKGYSVLVYIRAVNDGNYILAYKSTRGMTQDTELVTWFIMLAGVSIAMVGTASFWILLKPTADRLEKMTAITKNMSQMDFGNEVVCDSRDEFGILADSINTLSKELSSKINELNSELESKKSFVRNFSHEVKSPLTTIKGYAENAQIMVEGDDRLKHYMDIIIDECDSMNNLAVKMMNLSMLEDDEFMCRLDEIPTREFLTEIYEKYKVNNPKADMKMEADAATLRGDAVLLGAAISNYIDNALKYGGEKCHIKVEFKVEGDVGVFRVGNDGPKIIKENHEKIWDVFYKQDEARTRDKSYGIGLSFVAQVARKHNGGVKMSSNDEWTEFVLWIPLHLDYKKQAYHNLESEQSD